MPQRHHLMLLGVALIFCAWAAWRWGPTLVALLQDEAALEVFILRLGWWGPLALIALNAVQIVVAPIPGYAAQFAAGYLFGPWWGGLYGSLGLLAGAALAMTLARLYGRPLVERTIGAERLARWENVTHSESVLVWFLIILAPTGDLPYFMAGLARVSFRTVLLLTLAVRVPTTLLVAAVGAGAVRMSGGQIAAAAAVVGALLVFLAWRKDALKRWLDDHLARRIVRSGAAQSVEGTLEQ